MSDGRARRRRGAHPVRAVYDGTVQLGSVFEAGEEFAAVLVSGRTLGRFSTDLEAARAISGARHREAAE